MSDLSWAQLAAFNITLLVAMAAPGPAFLLVLRNSIALGRRAGVMTGVGLGVMAAIWTAAALAGLAALFDLVPWAYAAMKTIGALYLIYLAWGMWRGAAQPLKAASDHASRRAFRAGLLVNLTNPKSVLFAGAVIVVIFPAGLSLTDSVLIVANHLAVELCVYAAMAFGLSTAPARAAYVRIKSWADRIAAAVLGALGMRLLFER
ncbi:MULTISPECIES: LysE family translocator [Roseobacter]|uniref:LysE-type translocator n=1 Tax=Roseobacter litoralis (strain ATCC 49566 / DSM 6996 / JCM 21268 / NBRC 15278 / OCh 149) TaxID=391595 RepID=F7ZC04_ROSLO|nr:MULTISPECIES: LysE family transporter [Roseobacter]AEI94390.1 LysE-type translocator [Roseobacter litoralis Och 149]GIT87169.1 threonine transporter [Roseobacter sp. OBYS 0001]